MLNIQKVCLKSLLFLVIMSYKKLCKRMSQQFLNLVLTKCEFAIIDLLAISKSPNFAHLHPIIDKVMVFITNHLTCATLRHNTPVQSEQGLCTQ